MFVLLYAVWCKGLMFARDKLLLNLIADNYQVSEYMLNMLALVHKIPVTQDPMM